ncbi:DUF3181 family protein [Synechococcales cyanobacterium C]|uniref:DUF3181 family protein n=1 Tax=Petrachloros mirabilis ULC683 TaxID=2781853 RepID=A0A8K2A763_9CYAN|nr:DUF3181 family protein [Petrachloros mirabilis]NCJ05844.1 DUF3181 family protein [Petrachloros mirabilis ULC683]
MSNATSSQAIEDLAADIGKNIYIDVAKWHLYLADAHLHTLLAERFMPMLTAGSVSEAQVSEVLADIPVKLGGGRLELPLAELLPMQCQVSLIDILEEHQRDL